MSAARGVEDYDKFDVDKELSRLRDRWDNASKSLKEVEIFRHLDDDECLEIASKLTIVHYQDGDDIVVQGENGDGFFIIIKGSATVHQKPSTHQTPIQISTLHPFDYFGATPLAFNQPNAATVKASGPLKCVTMNAEDFQLTVKPVLNLLKRAVEQYNSFLKLSV